MKTIKEVNNFINTLDEELQFLIKEDSDFFQEKVGNAILRRNIVLDNSWSLYLLSDIDIYYYHDMMKFNDNLDMFGIKGFIPPIRSNDKAMILIYRFTCYDILGKPMDMVTGFHVGVLEGNGTQRDRKIFVFG